jgi:hypothetical protein
VSWVKISAPTIPALAAFKEEIWGQRFGVRRFGVRVKILEIWGQSKNSVLNLLRLWDFTLTPNITKVTTRIWAPIKFQLQDINKTMGVLNLFYVQASFAYVKKP